jgi:glycosyltransferase involved in cell wall biosynthesis
MDLAQALSDAGKPTRVWARKTGKTTTFDQALPWEMHRIRGRHWSRWRGRWVEIALLGQVHADDRLIFANWGLARDMMGAIRRRGAQFGLAFHGSDLTQLNAAPAELHQLVGAADALLPVSEFLANEMCRLGLVNRSDPRIHVLPMPLAEMPQRSGQGQGLICVARPTDLKGIDRAQALAMALDMELTLVGPESPGTGVLPRSEVHAAMARSAACLLLPKTNAAGLGAEGLGLVLLEAAAQGVPVIGCATGGVPEAVGPGLIIDADSPDLAAIRAFLSDETAGDRARAWVQKHHGARHTLATLEDALK